jgi:DNA gyrase subunit A
VRIINLREGDAIASVMAVPKSEDDEPTENVIATEATAEGAEVATEAAEAAEAVEATSQE